MSEKDENKIRKSILKNLKYGWLSTFIILHGVNIQAT